MFGNLFKRNKISLEDVDSLLRLSGGSLSETVESLQKKEADLAAKVREILSDAAIEQSRAEDDYAVALATLQQKLFVALQSVEEMRNSTAPMQVLANDIGVITSKFKYS